MIAALLLLKRNDRSREVLSNHLCFNKKMLKVGKLQHNLSNTHQKAGKRVLLNVGVMEVEI